MPLQNRVLPTGEIIAHPGRGTLTGNRGILHRPDRTLGIARWTHKAWICCTLDWQGRKRIPMTGRNWTELFFLDEATAFAAGHRPCGYCRREAYKFFKSLWASVTGAPTTAPMIDAHLHTARLMTGTRMQRTHIADIETLPDGAMILYENRPHLLHHAALTPYSPHGYGTKIAAPRSAMVEVLTPAPLITILKAGYQVTLHPTVTGQS